MKNSKCGCFVYIHFLIKLPMTWTVSSSVPQVSQVRILEWLTISFSGGIFPDKRIKSSSPAWQGEFLPLLSPGKSDTTATEHTHLLRASVQVFPFPTGPASHQVSLPEIYLYSYSIFFHYKAQVGWNGLKFKSSSALNKV